MTTKFEGGPAAGVRLTLKRAPKYLRVVRDSEGKWDALDALDDTPAPGEAVIAYRKVSDDGAGFIDYTDGRGRRCGTSFISATYAVCDPQPPDDVLRDRERWAEWATAEHAREQAAKEEPHV
jgi:hypothetical protein